MREIHAFTSAKFLIAMAGLLICSHGWAEGTPSPSAGQIQSTVNCKLLSTSLICKAEYDSFSFDAVMDSDISAGVVGSGTMTLETSASDYKNVDCSIELDPHPNTVTGSIRCQNYSATLIQEVTYKRFAEPVRGSGGFY